MQLNSGNDMAANLRAAGEAVRAAAGQGAQFIMLPEYVALLDGSGRVMRDNSYAEEGHPALAAFQSLSRETGAWLLVGSVTVKLDGEQMANRSYLLSSAGAVVARYDKIHMFDVTLPSGKVIRESSAYRPGARAVIAATPWGVLGMSVCYDLRFPHVYRDLAQAGAVLLAVPSSFQRETGIAHWHTLLRARAIENLCYVVASAQCGMHPSGRQTWGHSMIIDPGGEVIRLGGREEEILDAVFDLAALKKHREKGIYGRHHRQPGTYGPLMQP